LNKGKQIISCTFSQICSYLASKMPLIKGGTFDRAFHKSEIETMMERAAGAPGPGEVSPLNRSIFQIPMHNG
jgi:hypothetical protein